MLTLHANDVLTVLPHRSKDRLRGDITNLRVEPSTSGVLLIATDGHTLIVLHESLAPAIKAPYNVHITKDTERALKTKNSDVYDRYLHVDVDGRARVLHGEQQVIHIQPENALIDGASYAPWRDVLTQYALEKAKPGNPPNAAIDGQLLARFDPDKKGLQLTYGMASDDPVIVRIPQRPNVFGVVMPMRYEPLAETFPNFLGL